MKRYTFVLSLLMGLLVSVVVPVSPVYAKLTNSSSDTPEKLKFRESCYAAKTAALQAELAAKTIDISIFLKRKTDGYNECSDQARKMDVPEKSSASKAAPAASSKPVQTATKVKEVLDNGAKNYRARFYSACMNVYKNDDRVAACCSAQADLDTSSMEKKGAFDTKTTAELPVFVDESKCSVPEKIVIDSRCAPFDEGAQGEACTTYLKNCLASGAYASLSEKGRAESCKFDFASNKPITLTTQDKYVNICIADGLKHGENEESLKTTCVRGYYRGAQEYISRCLAMTHHVEYSKASTFILRLRSIFNRGQYQAEVKECLSKYDAALSKMTP